MPSDPEPRPFHVATVEHLIALMGTHDLNEVTLREGNKVIRLRRGTAPVVVTAAAAPAPVAQPTAASAPAATPAAEAPPSKKLLEIKSEMVGMVYLKPKPDKDEFVRVGSKVKPETTVCTIEAMKIFNDIKAGVSGTVAEVCVSSGDVAEHGTVLFRIDPGL